METGIAATHTSRLSITADQLHHDILEQIFVFLVDDLDFTSLKAASLVCRSWAASTRRHVFESVQMRPSNLTTLVEILTQHPRETVVPHTRRLETYGSPGSTYRGCAFLDKISCQLTHFTMRDSTVESFELVASTLHHMHQLQSLAILDVQFPTPSTQAATRCAGTLLPRSVRRFRIRNTPLYPFLAWFCAHAELPPMTHLDLGQLGDGELHFAEKLLFRLSPSLRHIILTFGYGAVGHACYDGKMVFDLSTSLAGWGKGIAVKPRVNSARFQEVFGIPICAIFSLMDSLTVVQIEGFVAADSAPLSTAEFLAARLLASVPGTHVERIVLGLGISTAAQLCRYNINWSFFDEIFTSDAYKNLQRVEFHHVGRGNLENIADYIAMKLPLACSKRLLYFCKAKQGLTASDYLDE